MKENNRLLLLNLIREQPRSRAELAKATGLTRAAVTLIVNEIKNDGILVETGAGESDYGRKPVLLDLNAHRYYSVGLYIERERYHIGLVNIKGEVLKESSFALDQKQSFEQHINRIVHEINILLKNASQKDGKLLGIGVSTPGPVDIYAGTILNPPNFEAWHHAGIVGELQKNFSVPIFLENNSSSLTLLEKHYGKGTAYENFMLIVVDTGVGAGMIIGNKLYRGAGGFACEVGHASIDMNGKPCGCGNKGCLEVYASVPAILELGRQKGRELMSWKQITDGAHEGDSVCIALLEAEAEYLSQAIVNIVNLLELEAVILAGDIRYRSDILLEKIRGSVRDIAMMRNVRQVEIKSSSVIEYAEVVSAASIVIEQFFRGKITTLTQGNH